MKMKTPKIPVENCSDREIREALMNFSNIESGKTRIVDEFLKRMQEKYGERL